MSGGEHSLDHDIGERAPGAPLRDIATLSIYAALGESAADRRVSGHVVQEIALPEHFRSC